MRITGGIFRNRSILSPAHPELRPTQGKIRSALFNMVQASIEGAHFLDICAGSGAVGLEAISRGAASCCFIEKDRRRARTIAQNIELLGVDAQAKLIVGDAVTTLKRVPREPRFDIVYVDPPYSTQDGDPDSWLSRRLVMLLDTMCAMLSPNALIFIEEGNPFALSSLELEHMQLFSERRYGESILFCLRLNK
jgi:16S rRNA (guanine966-N2)-methyltransferase